MAGLFFCLASANGAGLLFCPAAIQPHTSAFTTAFISSMQLYRPRRKTAHGALQKLFRRFVPLNCHRYKADTSGYNTVCATLERTHAPGRPAPIPDTSATPDAAQASTTAYYNKVYKRSADHASPAGSRCFPRPATCDLAPGQQSGRTRSVRHHPPGEAVQ